MKFSWRFIFAMLAVWTGLSIILLAKFMQETNPDGREQHPIHLKRIVKNYVALIKNTEYLRNGLAICLLMAGMVAWIAAGPFLVMQEYHYSVLWFGIFQALVFGCFIIGSRLVKHMMVYFEISRLITIGLSITLLGSVICLIAAFTIPQHFVAFVIALMLFAGGSGLVFSPLQRLAIEASKEPMGARMALISSLIGIFGVIGSGLVGLFYEGDIKTLAYIVAAMGILACGCRWYRFVPSLLRRYAPRNDGGN